MSGGGETGPELDHAAHVADVESRHPKFGAFLRRATEDSEVREAYYAAQSRRDGDDNADSPAEPRRVVEPGDTAVHAGLEGPLGGASEASGLEAAPELAGPVGRARDGLTPPAAVSRWEIRHSGPRQFHPVFVAGNGEDVMWGEVYTTKRKAREAIEVVLLLGPVAWRDGRVRYVEVKSLAAVAARAERE